MRKRNAATILVGVAAALSLGSGAFAAGPSGSSEDGANNVSCGAGTATPTGNVIYVGANGVESCNSDPAATTNGRVIVSVEGGYVTADGANDNTGTSYGFIRIGGGEDPVSCGSEDPSNPMSGAEADNASTSSDNDASAGGGNLANCTD